MSMPAWPSKIGRFTVKRQSWGRAGYAYKGYPWRLVLHTTETTGFPGYSSGASQPTWTIKLVGHDDLEVRQHQSALVGARALLGTSTNTANCLQVEQVMYSDQALARSVGGLWVGDLSAAQLDTLGEFYRALCDLYEIPPVAYAGPRMSRATWLARNGWGVCEHADVVDNTHWDCGVLDVVGALASAAADVGSSVAKPAPAKPSRDEDRKPPARPTKATKLVVDGKAGKATVSEMQRQLGTYPDGRISSQPLVWKPKLYAWSTIDYAANAKGSPMIAELQKVIGADRDGKFGPGTAGRLQKWLNSHGHRVTVDNVAGPNTIKALQRSLNKGDLK